MYIPQHTQMHGLQKNIKNLVEHGEQQNDNT
jgi:hypothetical protein